MALQYQGELEPSSSSSLCGAVLRANQALVNVFRHQEAAWTKYLGTHAEKTECSTSISKELDSINMIKDRENIMSPSFLTMTTTREKQKEGRLLGSWFQDTASWLRCDAVVVTWERCGGRIV